MCNAKLARIGHGIHQTYNGDTCLDKGHDVEKVPQPFTEYRCNTCSITGRCTA